MTNSDLLLAIAILTARLILGLLFVFQGIDKLRIPASGLNAFTPAPLRDRMPGSFQVFLIRTGSVVEIGGGILLAFGFLMPYALILLAANMVVVALAFSLVNPLWDMQHYFPRLALLLLLMFVTSLAPDGIDYLSLDYYLNNKI